MPSTAFTKQNTYLFTVLLRLLPIEHSPSVHNFMSGQNVFVAFSNCAIYVVKALICGNESHFSFSIVIIVS